MQQYWTAVSAILLFTASFFLGQSSLADNHLPTGRVSDVRNTKHNLSVLSSAASRSVSANTENEICVFCHTPHAANLQQGPLWNRELSGAAYDTYNSGSLDATAEGVALNPPNGISKLCLSCHDGTIAIGAVRVLDGAWVGGSPAISMSGVQGDGTMPAGPIGETSGFTRRIGTDLTNDHPISLTYDTALAVEDGEMRDPATEAHIGNRTPGNSPHVPLENGQVQCNSCHDPHIRDEADPSLSIKFLRLNRFQRVSPNNTTFNEANDIICLACHDKAGWVGSAHATDTIANETYTNAAANLRDFPIGTQVWESACLACHDTHTVQGSRRLLREGTDGPVANGAKQGGDAAIEETCFACHSNDGGTLTSQGDNTEVPNIKSDFSLPRHMPITNSEQPAGMEMHDIGRVDLDTQETGQRGADFIESRARLGKQSMGGSLNNRHAECTDCHNPHRVVRRRFFNQDNLSGSEPEGTHRHIDGITHTNIASGVLRGTWGVEPSYNNNNFNANPESAITFEIKRGDPSNSGSGGTDVTEPYVTREYQVCLKCHSNYAYDTPPLLGSFSGGTPSGTNGMTRYTNQAQEYNSPDSHRGQVSMGADGGAGGSWNTNNHRSWHPVMNSTGRTAATRNANADNWHTPFRALGTQTMYCTDCHGTNTANGTVIPDGGTNGNPWGPHGSTNDFILKGQWSGARDTGTGVGQQDDLCFKCHDYDEYASTNGTGASGFGGGGMCGMGCMGGMNSANFHRFHIPRVSNFRCNLCHVAVPHGWKNKAFLVNLNDVGPEGGFGGTGNQVRNGTTTGYVNGPYYNRAVLKVRSFASSGNWQAGNCGSSGAPGNGASGVQWMRNSSEACNNVP